MDKAAVDKLSKVFLEAMKTPALQQLAVKNGMSVNIGGSEEAAEKIRDIWKIHANVTEDFNVEVQK